MRRGQALLRPAASSVGWDLRTWSEKDISDLLALGWVLPSIVSGLREDPFTHPQETRRGTATQTANPDRARNSPSGQADDRSISVEEPAAYARSAGSALERLVALAFAGRYGELEESLAHGFKADAIRQAESRTAHGTSPWIADPGWVMRNLRLFTEVGLNNAKSWYARIPLYQALALYTIAGADAPSALDTFARCLRRGGPEQHPFSQRAARLTRAGLRRHLIASPRWTAYIWRDESEVAGRRATTLHSGVAQLVADVTLLLGLNEGSLEGRPRFFGYMMELPYCLSHSLDRREILETGCLRLEPVSI